MRYVKAPLLAVLLLLVSASWADAAIAFVQKCNAASTSASSTTQACTMSSNTTSGNMIYVIITNDDATGATTMSVSDGTNTYVSIDKCNAGSQGTQEAFYAKNITGLTTPTITVTMSSSRAFRDLSVLEYSGVDTTSPLDQHTCSSSSSFSTGTDGVFLGTPGSTTTDGQLVVGAAWCGIAVNVTMSAGSGGSYHERVNQGNSGTTTTQLAEDLFQSSAGATQLNWTSNNASEIVHIATFKAATGGGTQNKRRGSIL